ncbi:DPP IV N-terminal domain-containing protein [Stieleria varia]|uniref:DPP IV N-terminal domain-containing protein n=1 Tax=Stieleria varia TaxID=2528005 RepID=UPI0018D20E1D|nr:DPP IV N-terminal domain-containing protein [Stieleria varia]
MVWLITGLCVISLGPGAHADQQPSDEQARTARERFDYAETYSRRTRDRVFRQSVKPTWFGKDDRYLWYRVRTSADGGEYVLVDSQAGSRSLAFDHAKLAQQLSEQSSRRVDAQQLRFASLTFDESAEFCRFRYANQSWRFQLPDGPLTRHDGQPDMTSDSESTGERLSAQQTIARSEGQGEETSIEFQNELTVPLRFYWVTDSGDRRPYGIIDAGKSHRQHTFAGHAWLLTDPTGESIASFVADAWQTRAVIDADTAKPKNATTRNPRRRRGGSESPDGQYRVSFDGDNVFLKHVDDDDQPQQVTVDGDSDNGYGNNVWWSPDSQHFVVMKTKRVSPRQISIVKSSPPGSIDAELVTVNYPKPGDELDQPRCVLFHVDDPKPILIQNDLFSNPFSINDLAWNADSGSFSFVYNQRGHQTLRVVSVDAQTAEPRAMIDETSETFVCYSHKQFLQRLDATNEAIWMSERSGWNHLYLIDQSTGEVIQPITSGEWVVRSVQRVDVQRRQIWLVAGGLNPDEDPYHQHLVRVDFDGSNLVDLTPGDGEHQWSFSPDQTQLLDTYSRVDMPPVTVLRNADTGELITELERADATELTETGWQMPERFVASGRDGETPIHGIIVRPTNFDPHQRYPVVEAIYAGPHAAFVPKSFGLHQSLYQMADLGFIVVKIDGMGTSFRSKAFHDVCWQNLGDSGFPDRVKWIRAAAADRPEMDITRVGIWGGSAGGQSAMRALISHGDLYDAAVADCGCHDNRVDKIWWNEQWMGWPIGPHYEQQSNVTGASELSGDLMLIWGELDTNVDPISSMQVVDALIKADKDFEMLIVPGVGHGAAGTPYAKRRQAEFLMRKLGVAAR